MTYKTEEQINKEFDELEWPMSLANTGVDMEMIERDKQVKAFIHQVREEDREVARWDIARLATYTEHNRACIRSQFEAGRPTKNGGYETKFAGTWYESKPVDKTPKCDCGLDDLLAFLDTLE